MAELFFRQYGDPGKPAVLLLHGLFGSSANLSPFARRLEQDHFLLLPDLRNHGRSFHDSRMDYPSMAEDLLSLLDSLSIESASVVGHSMGGKAGMCFALRAPERVDRLMVVDIAPVSYSHDFGPILSAFKAVDTRVLASRDEADSIMAQTLPSQMLRQFLLQNLVKSPQAWHWRVNLPAIENAVQSLTGFPEYTGEQYAGTAWFVHGTRSDYVTEVHLPAIRALFPLAKMRPVAGAGHWLYNERPDAFASLLDAFVKVP